MARLSKKELERIAKRQSNIERNFKPLTRLEAIQQYYISGIELNDDQEKYRQLLEMINGMLCQRSTKAQVIKTIKRFERFRTEFKRHPQKASRAVEEALELFGDISKSNKAGLVHILSERQMRLAAIAEESGDYETASKIYERIGKMNGLPEQTELKKRQRRVSVIYSTDPKVLHAQEEIETYG